MLRRTRPDESLRTAFRAATAHGERAACLLCHPHNPTGTVHRREDLAMLASLAEEQSRR